MTELIIVFICLVLNALLAGYEMAFVSVTKPQLRQLAKSGATSAHRLLALRENPERTLSVVQVGITLVGMISAAVGGAGAEESFAPYFETRFGWSENVAEAVAILMIALPLTFLSVVLGELVPKSLALRNPLVFAMAGARWIGLADRLMAPLVSVLEVATKFILFFFPRRATAIADVPASVDIEHLSKPTQQYVLNLVSVETRKARDVMVGWSTVNSVNETATRDQVASTVLNSGHTRLPVMSEGRVVGLLHTKEFITLLAAGEPQWQRLIRPVLRVRENAFALAALRAMQSQRSHLCVVVDAQDAPVGILTLEDVIEEVVGEIFDEDDDGRVRRFLSGVARRRGRSP
ncbi:MAG: hemolysin family protein [Bdellovibrionaceae bacterium]|nr:hemolysin family protein [Pseudobdellovibrionaceae bacterium]